MSQRLDPNRPKLPDLKPLVVAYMLEVEARVSALRAGRFTGVCIDPLHCFMEDANLGDAFLDLSDYRADAAQMPATRTLAAALKSMSMTQRRKVVARATDWLWEARPDTAPEWWRVERAKATAP